MYEDGGIALKVLQKITAAEMPSSCRLKLEGSYLPK